ncbi:universal stress protein [Amphritea sp.]|uniref:universal stress protein n=1 Tax=Amphritea sp. TaxID=1872502 RepID=UPI003A9131BF
MLPKIKKILYASDIEKGSRPALRSAISLCGQEQSEIIYLHVIEPLSASTQSVVKSIINEHDLNELHDQSIENLKRTMQTRLERFYVAEIEAHEHLEPQNITARVEEGQPWKVILKVAEEIEADVIVMGTRTHSAVGEFLLGSTANKVIHHSKRPVLIVPL